MTIRNRPLKHLSIIPALAGVLILAACTKGAPLSKGPCSVVVTGDYRLLVASTTPKIEHGLMYVRETPRNRGMVFIEPPNTPATFWMIIRDQYLTRSYKKNWEAHRDHSE